MWLWTSPLEAAVVAVHLSLGRCAHPGCSTASHPSHPTLVLGHTCSCAAIKTTAATSGRERNVTPAWTMLLRGRRQDSLLPDCAHLRFIYPCVIYFSKSVCWVLWMNPVLQGDTVFRSGHQQGINSILNADSVLFSSPLVFHMST